MHRCYCISVTRDDHFPVQAQVYKAAHTSLGHGIEPMETIPAIERQT